MKPFADSPWTLVPAGSLCGPKESIDPGGEPRKHFTYVDISAVSNSSNTIITSRRLVGSEAPSRARKRIREGDVILATTRPYLKSIAMVPAELDGAVCSTGFCVLRSAVGVIPEWLFYCVQSDDFIGQLKGRMRGANYPAVTDRDVHESVLPHPPISDQIRIVARIQSCMERVREMSHLHEKSVCQAKAVFPSLVEDLMAEGDGEDASMADACDIEGVLVDPREAKYRKMKHVGGANIVAETGQLVDLKTAEEENLISGKFVFTSEDVLYSKIRPYLKKVVRPEYSGLCSADIYPLRPRKDRLNKDYLFFLLLSRNYTEYAIRVSNRAGMPKVNRNQLFAYRFKLPPLKVQERLVDKMDAAYQAALGLRSQLHEVGKNISHIQSSVLSKAFAGEL